MCDASMVGSNQHFQGFFHASSHDEQSLVSAFEDMTFRSRAADSPTNRRIAALTNRHYPYGHRDFTLNQSCVSATHQDESIPLQFGAAYANQKIDELAFEDYDQDYSFPPHFGNFSRHSRQPNYDSILSIPHNPSTASPLPFQQHCYVDGQSLMCTPYDQPIGSNFTLRHDIDAHSGDFCQFWQQEKVACLYGPGFSQNGIIGNNTMNYPERILMRPDSANPVRSIKFSPSANGYTNMDQRINGFEHNHLDIQSNDSLSLEWLKPQFMSSKYISESAMESLTYNSVDEVVGRICTVAKDQNGCRFLQKVFTKGTPEDAEKVFAEIIDDIGGLMVDPIAHYLVQKILEECSNDQRMHIIYEITKIPIIETIDAPEQALKLVSALSPGAMRLMTDPNGSQVVHHCLQKLLPEHNTFLLDAAASHHLILARNCHGCCVLQKCIEHSNDDQKNNLLNNITSCALKLSEDHNGNYVIQFILSLEIEWATSKIVDELERHFGNLLMQKCGSHVVEQCLKLALQLVRERIINELMNDPKLPHIMLDQYGKYVIQTTLTESKGAQHTAFVEAIRPHVATRYARQSNMFGKGLYKEHT